MLADEETERRIRAEQERDDMLKKLSKATKDLDFERKQIIRVNNRDEHIETVRK